jgi:hypothetical protein
MGFSRGDYDRLLDGIDEIANGLLLAPTEHDRFDRFTVCFEPVPEVRARLSVSLVADSSPA